MRRLLSLGMLTMGRTSTSRRLCLLFAATIVAVVTGWGQDASVRHLLVVCCQGELDRATRLRQIAEQGVDIASLRAIAHREGFELIERDTHCYALSDTVLATPSRIEADMLECLSRGGGTASEESCSAAKLFMHHCLQLLTNRAELMSEFVRTVESKAGLSVLDWKEQAEWSLHLKGRLSASSEGYDVIFLDECEYVPGSLPKQGSAPSSEKHGGQNSPAERPPVVEPCKDYHILCTNTIPHDKRLEWTRAAIELIRQREVVERQRLRLLVEQLQSHYRAELAGKTLRFEEAPPEVQQSIKESIEGFGESASPQNPNITYKFL